MFQSKRRKRGMSCRSVGESLSRFHRATGLVPRTQSQEGKGKDTKWEGKKKNYEIVTESQ